MRQLEYLKDRIESTISPMDFMHFQKENPNSVVLVDVRNGPKELREVKIKGALEIMQVDIEKNLDKLPKDKVIVTYCWETWCNLATKANIVLLENGFKVKELHGGIGAWKELELPIEKL